MIRTLILIACMVIMACGSPAQEAEIVQTVNEPEWSEPETSTSEASSQPEHEAPQVGKVEVVEEGVELVEDVEVEGHIGRFPPNSTVASIEERVLLSDVIVRANLVSAANDILTFDAVEYLRGTGPSRFTVGAATAGRNTEWDGDEAILFLSSSDSSGRRAQSGTTTFKFPDTTDVSWDTFYNASAYEGELEDGYTIDAVNPVWIPAETEAAGASGNSAASRTYVEASHSPLGTESPTVTLEKIKAVIAFIDGGEGIEGYDSCVLKYVGWIRRLRDREAYYGERLEVPTDTLTWESGAGSLEFIYGGDTVWGMRVDPRTGRDGDPWYGRVDVVGEHADLFGGVIVDDDADPSNGYVMDARAKRPLPAGTYRITTKVRLYETIPCDFNPPTIAGSGSHKVIKITAPVGTVWEALFDPNSTGFDSRGGELSPRALTVNGTTSTISGLTYGDGKVVITADQWAEVADLEWNFIGVDGTVAFSLLPAGVAKDTDNNTLTWSVDEAPWSDGDKLMIRVVQANRPPEFSQDSYTFEVAENASTWTTVGTISATDPDGDLDSTQAGDGVFTIYSVVSGHDQSKIRMDASAGFFMVWGALDYETTSSYTFNVQVSDGKGGTDTATVTINVTDVEE